MSGHSKWHSIKHKKAVTDGKRSQLFGRLSRDIRIAARKGTDPNANYALREAIERAKKSNLPMSNIERILSNQNGEATSLLYEGHGVSGVAILIDTITSNTNRTVSELRAIMKRHNGSLGSPNSVRWQFTPRATITATTPATINKDDFELSLIDAGADDISYQDDTVVVTTPPDKQRTVEDILTTLGATNCDATISYYVPPHQQMSLTEEQQEQLESLLTELESQEDVTAIFTNRQE